MESILMKVEMKIKQYHDEQINLEYFHHIYIFLNLKVNILINLFLMQEQKF